MKYFKRLKCYKNSTGTNKYYPEQGNERAFSYDHWQYLTNFNGKLIFNNYSYSISTSKHQSETYGILNYCVDICLIFTRESLDCWGFHKALEGEIKGAESKIEEYQAKLNNPRCKRSLDEGRKAEIKALKHHIGEVKEVLQELKEQEQGVSEAV